VDRTQLAVGEETFDFEVDGRTIRIATRSSDADGLARLFDLGGRPSWSDSSPLTDAEVARVVRRLIDTARDRDEAIEVVGVAPGAANAFPEDRRVFVSTVEPMSFSLPAAPYGLAFELDEHGNGRLWAVGLQRVELGSDGMWWIVTQLIDALENPVRAAGYHRFLTLATTLGGPATQASLEYGDWGVGVVWRKLESGVVGDLVAVNELTYERLEGWLSILRPVKAEVEKRRAHRQRLRPAKTAERWARALERWSS
jgi:hypothetical protein